MKSLLQYIVLLLTLVIIQPAQAAQEDLDKASLLLQWTPQAQFAGYFMAQEKGFYRQQGIDLTIITGGPDKVVSDSLATGKVSFGTMFLSTALKHRAAGMPLVNIGQIIQDSTLMLIARAGTGIESIADLDQKKVAIWANEFQIQLRMLFDQAGIEVTIVPQGGTMDLFLYGAVSATSGMWYNEYHTILSAGLRQEELKTFFLRDTPYGFPEDGIYCLEDTFEHNPKMAMSMLKATMDGWQYAFDHEEETLDIVTRYMTEANLPVNRVHQRWMFRRMRDVLQTEGKLGSSVLKRETFDGVMSHLFESQVIQTPVDFDAFYRGPSQ